MFAAIILILLQTQLEAMCLTDETIELFRKGEFHCSSLMDYSRATTAQLPNHCHIQGIGRWNASSPLLATCQDKTASKARILNFESTTSAVQVINTSIPPHGNHPSAIQIYSDFVAIAIAQSTNTGPTELQFYSISSKKIHQLHSSSFTFETGHLGALAFSSIEPQEFHLIGCGWNCETITFWTGMYQNNSFSFQQYQSTTTKSLLDPSGIDSKVGNYNSLYLTTHCESERPLLICSHTTWIDIFEIQHLGTASVRLKKILKRQVPFTASLGLKPIFLEGMTLIPAPTCPWILAAPHDFDVHHCPKASSCSRRIYQCQFRSKWRFIRKHSADSVSSKAIT